MRQGCRTIELNGATAIICGGEPTDHKCNEDAIVYETKSGEKFYFKNSEEGHKWYQENYEQVISGSVACSICKRAAIDNSMWEI